MTVRPALSVMVLLGFGLPSVILAQANRPLRTFPEFVGTWVLDETASTGRLSITPRIARRLTIETTPETITITKELRLSPNDRRLLFPPPEVRHLERASPTDQRDPVRSDLRDAGSVEQPASHIHLQTRHQPAWQVATTPYSQRIAAPRRAANALGP